MQAISYFNEGGNNLYKVTISDWTNFNKMTKGEEPQHSLAISVASSSGSILKTWIEENHAKSSGFLEKIAEEEWGISFKDKEGRGRHYQWYVSKRIDFFLSE